MTETKQCRNQWCEPVVEAQRLKKALGELIETIVARNSQNGYADYLGTSRAYDSALKKAKKVLKDDNDKES